MSFTKSDIQQIEKKGLTVNNVESQIELFKSGIPFTNIVEAATIGNGITALDKILIEDSIAFLKQKRMM